jgi:hypothetical protein
MTIAARSKALERNGKSSLRAGDDDMGKVSGSASGAAPQRTIRRDVGALCSAVVVNRPQKSLPNPLKSSHKNQNKIKTI